MNRVRPGRAIALLTAAYLLSIIFRTYLGAIGPELARDFSIDNVGLGWLGAASFWSLGFAQIPLGIAFDRFGVERTIAASLAIGALGALGMATTSSWMLALAAQCAIGIGCAPVYAGILLRAFASMTTEQATRVGLVSGSVGMIGAVLTGTPLAYASELVGWRILLFVLGIVYAVVGLSVLRLPSVSAPSRGEGSSVRHAHGARLLMWAMVPTCLLMSVGSVLRMTWGSPYLAAVFDADVLQRGNAMTAISLIGVVAAYCNAWFLKHIGGRSVVTSWLLVGAICGFVLASGLVREMLPVVVLLALWFSVGNIHPVLIGVAQTLVEPRYKGRMLGAYNTLIFLGAGATSWMFGLGYDTLGGDTNPVHAFSLIFLGFGIATAIAAGTLSMGFLLARNSAIRNVDALVAIGEERRVNDHA